MEGHLFSEIQSQEQVDGQTSMQAIQGKVKNQYTTQLPVQNKTDSSESRKKNSFEDDDESDIGSYGYSSSTYAKKEYFLKGGDGIESSMRMPTAATICDQAMVSQQQTESSTNTLPKPNIKG